MRDSSGESKVWYSDELEARVKWGAIPIISNVPEFLWYYAVDAPDDTVTAISAHPSRSSWQQSTCGAVQVQKASMPSACG
jgi:hypothetical protein